MLNDLYIICRMTNFISIKELRGMYQEALVHAPWVPREFLTKKLKEMYPEGRVESTLQPLHTTMGSISMSRQIFGWFTSK
jgi:hypothetical protein